MGGCTGQFAVKPQARGSPIALYRNRGHFQHFGGFFHAQSAKEPHFDNLHFARVELEQSVHRIVKTHQIGILGAAYHCSLIQRDMLHAATAFLIPTARVFDQDASHELG